MYIHTLIRIKQMYEKKIAVHVYIANGPQERMQLHMKLYLINEHFARRDLYRAISAMARGFGFLQFYFVALHDKKIKRF